MRKIVIDAKNKSAGRIASQAVMLLRGKDTPAFTPNKLADISLVIINAAQVHIPILRENTKIYRRHSNYPGGFREKKLSVFKEKNPEQILRFAISGMLPKNRLKARALRRLKIFPSQEVKK